MSTLKKLQKNRFVKFGAPFIILLVGGSFGLKHFAQLRYTFSRRKQITEEEAESFGMKSKKERPTVESEYEKLHTEDRDTWTNIRGPRPWENSKSIQAQLREQHSS